MSERLDEQARIAELVTDALFERMHASLGRFARLFFVNPDRGHEVDRALQRRVVQGRGVSTVSATLLGRLCRINFWIRARKEGGFVQMRALVFKNERGHALGLALLKDLVFFHERLRHG